MIQKRHICWFCGAKKYQKYMKKSRLMAFKPFTLWECKNEEKCFKKSVNYRE